MSVCCMHVLPKYCTAFMEKNDWEVGHFLYTDCEAQYEYV